MILRNFILILASLFISYSFAQCSGNGGVSISPAKSSYCAGEPITFQVNNPNSNFEYRIRINGVTYDDTIVTVGLPGAATTKIYTVDVQFKGVIGGWISCQPLDILKPSVTISPSPDPTLIDVTPEPTQSSPFRQCQQLSNNYTLDVQNGSTTASSFNQTYIIDWGDGTTTGTISNFTNLSHTYNSPGGYTLAFTVSTSDLSAPCNTVTHYYDAYFGVLPNVGISKVGALIKCAPVTAEFLIDTSVTNRNPIGTSYDIFVGGELIATYNQPAPRNIFHTYTKTSCGENCSGKEYYEIKVVAKNGCGDLPATVCEPVSEQPKPILQVPDTVCIGVATPHINQTQEKDLQSNGTCQPLKTEWTITPSTGWTLNSGDMTEDPTINVTYDVAGTYLVEMRAISTLCGDSIITKNVVAVPKPDVAITVDKNSLCTGESVNVSNVSSNPSTVKYTWSITPNTGWTITSGSITSTNFTVLFNNASNYTITLSANQSGCTDVASETINVKEAPTITQQGIFDTLCSIPADLYPYFKFTFDKGGDANTTFNWELDGATPSSSSIENPGKITYANAGDYTVFVELVNQCGNDSIRVPFNIQDNPKPDAGTDFSICKNADNIILTGNPSGGVWSGQGFVNVNSGEWSPSSFANAGTYDLEYTINQSSACPTMDTLKATITEIVGLTAGPDQTICKPDLLELEGDPNFTGGNWIGTGVVNSSTGIFNASGLTPGNYSVGYVFQDASGTCSDTAYKIVTVYDSIHVSNNIPDLCVGQSFDFGTITGNMISALWDFGDGTPLGIITNPKHTYTSAGTYTVELQAETADGCKDTVFFTVNVIQNPDLSFIITPDSTCTGQNVAFSFPPTHQATNNYLWSFGVSTISDNAPNTQVVNFPVPSFADTLYPIVLKAKYYCGDVYAYDTVKVKAPAYAAFSVQTIGCSPYQPQLTNQSYGTPTNFYWDFGNGQTSNLANPIAPTYINTTNRDTTYTITLTASNICGTSTVSKTITVLGNQVEASFFTDITQGCEPLTVSFYSTSTVGTNQTWTFGDGEQGYGEQPAHTFTNNGTYNVKLLATSTCGKDSAYTTIKVLQKPTASFTVGATCVNSPTQFNNASTSANAYQWNFGDGDASSIKNPTHTYTSTGSYVVTMHAFNSNGCEDSTQLAIGVSTKPTADFDVPFPNVCLGEAIQFVNNSVSANSFLWNFGNGETSTVAAPNYVYPAAGTYTVSLLAINGSCRDSITKPAVAEVYPNPLADFIAYITDNGFEDPVEFTNTTAFGDEYLWVFGDGDSSVEVSPIHLYEFKKPNYKVYLYVVSEHGCTDTVIKIIGYEYDGTLFVPNVLAPELGAGNESSIFMPKGFNLKEYHIEIFSTYGQLLWESTALVDGQPAEGWDGTYKGKLLPQDVYVWKIRAIFENGQSWEGMASPEDIKNPPADLSKVKKRTMGSLLLIR